jgi:hypothetical protein
MPLRDHFRPPLDNKRHWESFHATWPVTIVAGLRLRLPRGYFAEPRVHSGRSAEIDVAALEDEDALRADAEAARGVEGNGNGGVATAVWAPPRPTVTLATDLPAQDLYEVRVYDEKRRSRLVAAVEIVSPANKDRPERRRAFVAKCAGLLRERVSVVIVDIVTTRTPNLCGELLEFIGQTDPKLIQEATLHVAACRVTRRNDDWLFEAWPQNLMPGQPLPTMPLWLADNLAIPLELEESYEESCTILSIP